MTALAEVQARIDSIRKLRSVVTAMRGIAAAHAQRARESLTGFRTYADVVSEGLGQAARLLAPVSSSARAVSGARVRVAFVAEHGFAGAFSERVLDLAAPGPRDELVLVGTRGRLLADQKGWTLAWSTPMASQAAGVGPAARRLADFLYRRLARGPVATVEVVFTKLSAGTNAAVVRKTILPIDYAGLGGAPASQPPLTNLPPQRLVEQLADEYVFAELALAALESFVSENVARLATMQSARLNTDRKLEELTGREQRLRQEEITAEVQDVVSGALAAETRRSPCASAAEDLTPPSSGLA